MAAQQHQKGGSRLQKLLKLIDGELRVASPRCELAVPLCHSNCRPGTSAGGSSLDIRKAAAAQIAGIAAAHPAQLPAVLAAVAAHLRHREWDARVAAGHCLGLLAEHFGHHTAQELEAAAAAGSAAAAATGEAELKQEDGGAGGGSGVHAQPHLLSFSSFSVQQVLAQGTPMLSSAGEVRMLWAGRRVGWIMAG